jgi:hypothetical protein
MYFKRGCSCFQKLKLNIIQKLNIINKIRCILNVDVRIMDTKLNIIRKL